MTAWIISDRVASRDLSKVVTFDPGSEGSKMVSCAEVRGNTSYTRAREVGACPEDSRIDLRKREKIVTNVLNIALLN